MVIATMATQEFQVPVPNTKLSIDAQASGILGSRGHDLGGRHARRARPDFRAA